LKYRNKIVGISLTAREEMLQFGPKSASLCLETRKRFQKIETVKYVMGSSIDEGGSCILETKNGRTTAPRPKLFSTAEILQDERQQF
jgi:hypothetical protein